MINPSFQHIFGRGKPRFLVYGNVLYTSSASTTFTSTGVVEGGSPSLAAIRAKMLITSFQVISGQPNKPVYAKITSVNDTTDTITVAEWIGGTPTNGQVFKVEGFVVDLPYCYDQTQTFTPDQLVHELWRSRLATKFFGWKYGAVMDYAKHLFDDIIIDLAPALNLKETDRLVFIPSVDKPGNQYNIIHNAPVNISRYGKSPGYKKISLTLRGKENVQWPIPQSGYGFNYAGGPYGENL